MLAGPARPRPPHTQGPVLNPDDHLCNDVGLLAEEDLGNDGGTRIVSDWVCIDGSQSVAASIGVEETRTLGSLATTVESADIRIGWMDSKPVVHANKMVAMVRKCGRSAANECVAQHCQHVVHMVRWNSNKPVAVCAIDQLPHLCALAANKNASHPGRSQEYLCQAQIHTIIGIISNVANQRRDKASPTGCNRDVGQVKNPVLVECAEPLPDIVCAEVPTLGTKELKECEGYVRSDKTKTPMHEDTALQAHILWNLRKGFLGRNAEGRLILPRRVGEPPSLRRASVNSRGNFLLGRTIARGRPGCYADPVSVITGRGAQCFSGDAAQGGIPGRAVGSNVTLEAKWDVSVDDG